MATTSAPPPTMRAWTHTKAGPPTKVLHLTTSHPTPKILKANEVLVKITHASLNPGASIFITLLPMIIRTPPQIPESDFAGTIIDIGSSVTSSRNFQPGTRVFGSIPIGQFVFKGKGALAEYVVVPAEMLCITPDGMKDEEAAGLGIAGCSALAFFEMAKIKEGERVLVNGASGGVGSFVVQMARNAVGERGEVVAMCSGNNAETVRALGANEVIDYTAHEPVHKYLAERYRENQFDWVLDAYGSQELWLNCASFLKPKKPYIIIGVAIPGIKWPSLFIMIGKTLSNMLWPRFLGGVDRPYVQIAAMTNLKAMEELVRTFEEGKLKVLIDSVLEFDGVLPGYEKILSKRARGKIIVRVGEPAVDEHRR